MVINKNKRGEKSLFYRHLENAEEAKITLLFLFRLLHALFSMEGLAHSLQGWDSNPAPHACQACDLNSSITGC